ncbi:MAG: hypothetical protein LBV17_07640, partial [Treponema sp.]|nr:hypothetical protein [Treponema sp.]
MEAEKIIIRRATPKTQEIDLHNGARLTAELIERLGDKLIMIVQEICQEIKSDIIDRELTFLKEIHANTIRARGISTWDFFVQNSATIMGNLSLQYGNIYAPYYAYIRSLEVSDSIEVNRNINTKNGEIREKGVRVYSPNNPPTLADVIVTDGKTIEGGGTQDEPLKIVDGAFVTPDELHEEKETRIKGDIDTLNDAKNYTDQTTANLNLKINSIENLGHYAGAFDAYALLPANTSEYPSGITVNDFATIRADETHGGDVTRYVVR